MKYTIIIYVDGKSRYSMAFDATELLEFIEYNENRVDDYINDLLADMYDEFNLWDIQDRLYYNVFNENNNLINL